MQPMNTHIILQLQAVTWYCMPGMGRPSEVSIVSLVGSAGNHHGLLDIILFTVDVLHDWMVVTMDTCQLSSSCTLIVCKSMSDFCLA